MLNRSVSFSVKGNNYQVSYPNVAQFIDIETTKARLSSDQYSKMAQIGTLMQIRALDYIDMVAYLTVLCPQLIKDLKAPILSLDIFDAKELLTVFKKDVEPWIGAWQGVLSEITPQEQEVEKENDWSDEE